jgi:hypothetical protein
MRSALALGRHLLLAGAGNGQAWLWLAAGLVTVVLVWRLYRDERRLVSRRVGVALLALRFLTAAVLVLALFEPIAARSYREVLRGRLIVGVDISDSMATVDTRRSADDQRRLSRALGLSPAEPPDILSRRAIARRILETDAFARLAGSHTIEAYAFARELVPGPISAVVAMLGQTSKAGEPSASVTDWAPVLAQALTETGDRTPVLGVVLLTDGQQNGTSNIDGLADRLAARGVPIYPILVGSTVPPRDAAVAFIRAPDSV